MSIGRSVFGQILSATIRKARSTEEFGRNAIQNFRVLRRLGFYMGSCYCAGQLFRHYYIEWGASTGPSMYPTMTDETPYIFLDKRYQHAKNMKPGDIINFTSPIFSNEAAGKRLIGLAGDYVALDAHMAPSVGGATVPGITDWRSKKEIEDGVELKERTEPMMIEVPEGHVFAVGDNMSWSRDSRFFGPVPMALVGGKQFLHGDFGQGWTWTAGSQLRRIPKEDEEEYLKACGRKRIQERAAAAQERSARSLEKVN